MSINNNNNPHIQTSELPCVVENFEIIISPSKDVSSFALSFDRNDVPTTLNLRAIEKIELHPNDRKLMVQARHPDLLLTFPNIPDGLVDRIYACTTVSVLSLNQDTPSFIISENMPMDVII